MILFAVIAIAVVAVVAKLSEQRLPQLYRAILTLAILAPIAACIYAIATLWQEWIGWRELILFLGLYLATGLGTTVGYHRLLTHRSFEAGAAVKGSLLALGAMNLQGHPITWAAHHLAHHAESDREGDPHSPREGFIHAHCGWLLRAPVADRERYCKRLLRDPVVVFVDRTAILWAIFGLALPYAVAGWKGLLWGGLVRIAFTNHATFAVNSICHMYGTRTFETRDLSRNNWLIGLLAFGEGWHNNHHAFPAMAVHGMTRWQFDLSGLVIRGLARVGLVWNVREAPVRALQTAPLQESRT